jgi:hypothetical protein
VSLRGGEADKAILQKRTMNKHINNLNVSMKIILAAIALAFMLPSVVSAARPAASGSMSCAASFSDLSKKRIAKDKAAKALADRAKAKAEKAKADAAPPAVKAAQKAYDKAKAKADAAFEKYDSKNPPSVAAYERARIEAEKAEDALSAAQAAAPSPSAAAQAKINKAQAAADAAFAQTAEARTVEYINQANLKADVVRAKVDAARAGVEAAEKAAREGGYTADLVSRAFEAGARLEAAKAEFAVAANAVEIARRGGEFAASVDNLADFFSNEDSELTYSDGSKKRLGDLNKSERAAVEAQQMTSLLAQQCRDRLRSQIDKKVSEACGQAQVDARSAFNKRNKCQYGTTCVATRSLNNAPEIAVSGSCKSNGKGTVTCQAVGPIKCDEEYACTCNSPPPGAPPEYDFCPNIPGIQRTAADVPAGWTITEYGCYPAISPPPGVPPVPDRTVPPELPRTIETGGVGAPQPRVIQTGPGAGLTPLQFQQQYLQQLLRQPVQSSQTIGPSILRGGPVFSQ